VRCYEERRTKIERKEEKNNYNARSEDEEKKNVK